MIKKNSLLFACLLVMSYLQAQQFGIRASVFRPYWGLNSPANVDSPITLTNKGNTIFDFNIGINADYALKKYVFSFNTMYEFNSMKSTAQHFHGNGEIIRFYNLYFWHNQLRVMREIRIHKRKFQVGVGLDLDIRIRKKKTLIERLNYIPIQGLDPQDQGKINFQHTFLNGAPETNIIPGIHIEARTEIGKMAGKSVYLYFNTSMTLAMILQYQWYYSGNVFAQYQGYRLTPRIGIQWDLTNDIRKKIKNNNQ